MHAGNRFSRNSIQRLMRIQNSACIRFQINSEIMRMQHMHPYVRQHSTHITTVYIHHAINNARQCRMQENLSPGKLSPRNLLEKFGAGRSRPRIHLRSLRRLEAHPTKGFILETLSRLRNRAAHRAVLQPIQSENSYKRFRGKRTTRCFETRMPGFGPSFLRHPRAYYARPPPSIMPGQSWRDNGHKALCPLSRPSVPGIQAARNYGINTRASLPEIQALGLVEKHGT
eukprot:COSAG02_NODE_6002_length_3882_cov_3.490087_3_plen_228_part_00